MDTTRDVYPRLKFWMAVFEPVIIIVADGGVVSARAVEPPPRALPGIFVAICALRAYLWRHTEVGTHGTAQPAYAIHSARGEVPHDVAVEKAVP